MVRQRGPLLSALLMLAALLASLSSAAVGEPRVGGWKVTDLGEGTARTINASGQVIGNGCPACPGLADLWQEGTEIGLADAQTDPDGSGSWAAAINDRGQVVGAREDRPVLWQGGRLIRLGLLPGAAAGAATALNESGQVVGWSGNPSGARHAVLWQNGSARDLGTLGGQVSEASAINDRGQVVGWADTSSGVPHAFLWSDGRMRDIGPAAGKASAANAINKRGTIIGSSAAAADRYGNLTGSVHGFVRQNATTVDLGRLFISVTGIALAINDRDQVVGARAVGDRQEGEIGGSQAFLWQNGRRLDLPQPRFASASGATAINERGQIVGWYERATAWQHAALWQDGRLTDLGLPPRNDSREAYAAARAINERGEIVGEVRYHMDFGHALLWRPARA